MSLHVFAARKNARAIVSLLLIFCAFFAGTTQPAHAIAPGDPGFKELDGLYYTRPDLMKLFDENTWRAKNPLTAPYPSLVVWAQASGHFEYPQLLAAFSPKASSIAGDTATTPTTVITQSPTTILFKQNPALAPKKATSAAFSASALTAKAAYVIDVDSETPLLGLNENKQYPVASLTKLMTATIALEKGLNMNGTFAMAASDEVGGARIAARAGSRFSITDLFYAMLVGSANNATNAISRASGLSRTQFVAEMNAKAKSFGLKQTKFVDPTGIELGNVSTAEEMALIALRAYEQPTIKRATTTARYQLTATHAIKNTNGLLVDNNNGLLVMGGKTGYLPEIGWNFIVKMRDTKGNRPLLIAVMGSGDRARSFEDAETVARWVWANYQWK